MNKNELMDALLTQIEIILKDFPKARGVNVLATKRIRLGLVRLEKIGKKFRAFTIAEEKQAKLKGDQSGS